MAKTRIIQGSNLAIALVQALGAYCPKVKIQDELSFNLQIQRAKRRTRPLSGRGYYSEFLRSHFAEQQLAAVQARQAKRQAKK